MLKKAEIRYILKLLAEKHGPGYSVAEVDGCSVGGFQAKLSVMAQAALR